MIRRVAIVLLLVVAGAGCGSSQPATPDEFARAWETRPAERSELAFQAAEDELLRGLSESELREVFGSRPDGREVNADDVLLTWTNHCSGGDQCYSLTLTLRGDAVRTAFFTDS